MKDNFINLVSEYADYVNSRRKTTEPNLPYWVAEKKVIGALKGLCKFNEELLEKAYSTISKMHIDNIEKLAIAIAKEKPIDKYFVNLKKATDNVNKTRIKASKKDKKGA